MALKHSKTKEKFRKLLTRISIDHDGTIANSRKAITDEFNKRFSTSYLETDLNYWDAVFDWCKKLGKTDDESSAVNYELWYTPDTLLKAEPNPGAIEFLLELHKQGYNFIINSSRSPELYESTIVWYQKHAPFVDTKQINVGLPDMDGTDSKIKRIKAAKSLLHIDDVPEHAHHILNNHGQIHVILLSNQKASGHGRMTHIKPHRKNQSPDFWDIHKLFFD